MINPKFQLLQNQDFNMKIIDNIKKKRDFLRYSKILYSLCNKKTLTPSDSDLADFCIRFLYGHSLTPYLDKALGSNFNLSLLLVKNGATPTKCGLRNMLKAKRDYVLDYFMDINGSWDEDYYAPGWPGFKLLRLMIKKRDPVKSNQTIRRLGRFNFRKTYNT